MDYELDGPGAVKGREREREDKFGILLMQLQSVFGFGKPPPSPHSLPLVAHSSFSRRLTDEMIALRGDLRLSVKVCLEQQCPSESRRSSAKPSEGIAGEIGSKTGVTSGLVQMDD